MAKPAGRSVTDERPPITDAGESNVGPDDTILGPAELPPPPRPVPADVEQLAENLLAPKHGDEFPAVPGYEVLGLLGRGGMGVVFLARQTALNRLVALKMMQARPGLAPGLAERFRTEVEAIARLQHPNIVQIFEVGEHDGRPFCALEFVDGGTLAQARRDALPSHTEAAALVETLARAVQYAHDQGVLHRDLKPSNVLMSRAPSAPGGSNQKTGTDNRIGHSGPESSLPAEHGPLPTVKIADFGLAKWLDDTTPAGVGTTETGMIIGTPSYMAPEQVAGDSQEVGVAADVYALGAILYELMTGRPPFKADTPLDTAIQTQFDDPMPPRRLQPKLPRDLETICLHCLHKAPARRYRSAEALAKDLRRFLSGRPIHARPVGAAERGWKWVRRHPAAAALAAVSLLTFLTLGSAGWAFLLREREHARDLTIERDAADKARQAKERYLQRSLETGERLRQVTNKYVQRTDPARMNRQLLSDMVDVYRKEVEQDQGDTDPAVRRVRATNLARLADLSKHLGKRNEAVGQQREAVAVVRQLIEEGPAEAHLRLDLGLQLDRLAMFVLLLDPKAAGPQAEALALQREAVSVLRGLPPELDRFYGHSVLGATLNNLALSLLDTGGNEHLPEVRALLEQAIEVQRMAHQVKSTTFTRRFLQNHHGVLAETLIRIGDHATAAAHARQLPGFLPNDAIGYADAAKRLEECSRVVLNDSTLPPEIRTELSAAYADEARRLTAEAEKRGRK